MLKRRITKYDVFGWAQMGVVLLCAAPVAVFGEPTPRMGTLQLEGTGIERLVLTDQAGHSREFNRPGATVTLPAGEYRLREVLLEGGYQCWPHQAPKRSLVAVSPNQPATLKVGAPLRQRIRPQRRGAVLALHFEIVGGAGELYRPPASAAKPHATVYRRDRQVLSADFEYG